MIARVNVACGRTTIEFMGILFYLYLNEFSSGTPSEMRLSKTAFYLVVRVYSSTLNLTNASEIYILIDGT